MPFIVLLLVCTLGCKQAYADGANKPQVRRGVPNLGGSSVTLGSLYDGRLDTLMTPLNLWSPQVINDNKIESNVGYSNTDFSTDEDILKRLDIMGVDAEMKLSFMGGLIKVAGGAKYLHDQDLNENTVRSTLIYKATTRSEVMPYGVPATHSNLCKLVTSKPTDSMTPTHVVTEVVYGLNAYMVFKKDFKSNSEKKEVSGYLNVVVKAVPSFQVNGSASFNLTEEQEEVSKTMALTFYGDVLLENPPSTFEDAVAVYKELPTKAQESQKVVSYTLTPITLYCDQQEAILNSINGQNIELVSSMQADFESIERKINSLSSSFVAVSFPRFSAVLRAFEMNFLEFKNGLNKDLQILLPQIRGGGSAQTELTDLVNRYRQGGYEKGKVDSFLAVRTKEIETVNNVLDIIYGTNIVVDDGRSGNGNKCLQDNEFTVVYTLRVLPEVSETDKYEYSSGHYWNETAKWFFDLEEVGKTGEVKRQFKQFYDDNRRASMCFLISLVLDLETDTSPAQLSVLKNGNEVIANFIPPPKVSSITRQERGWNNYKFVIEWPANDFVTKVQTKFWILSEGQSKDQAASTFTDVEAGSSTAEISLTKLEPNYQYGVAFVLWTSAGKGPESDEVIIQTHPTSPPSALSIVNLAANNLLVSWSAPFSIQHGVYVNGYEWKVRKDGSEEIFTGLKLDGDNSVQVKGLEAAENYDFLVRALPVAGGAMLKDSAEVTTPTQNLWQAVSFTTSPNKLVGVSVIDTAQNDLSLRWDPYDKISKSATFLHYEILLTSSLGEVLIRTAQQERAIISGLASGMTYAVQVKTVTTNGDSPFSNVLQVATKDMDVSSADSLIINLGLPMIEGQLTDRCRASYAQSQRLIENGGDSMQRLDALINEASTKKSLYFDAFSEISTTSALSKKIFYTNFGAFSSQSCGMDESSGVFTAPVTGAYFMTFTAIKSDVRWKAADVQLMVGDDENSAENMATIATGVQDGRYMLLGPLPLQAIVNMKKGQKAWVQWRHFGSLFSWNKRNTHFTGVLISAE